MTESPKLQSSGPYHAEAVGFRLRDLLAYFLKLGTLTIGLMTLATLMLTKKVPEPAIIIAAGAVGALLHHGSVV